MKTSLLLPLSTLLLAPVCTAQATKEKPQAPPSMLLVEGGTTLVGSTVEQIESEAAKNNNMIRARTVAELVQFKVKVDSFYLQATEVTNEQYLAYVEATGARPPEHWAEAVITEAQEAFLKEGHKGESFNRARWWRMNWEGKPWKFPEALATTPVVYVDYRDAQGFARWAGWRLPTEFEFQRAARGGTGNIYPWGDAWEDGHAANERMRLARPRPVASFPSGAVRGIYDLAGNVFEWTASPYQKYESHSDKLILKVGQGKRTEERPTAGLITWDTGRRVLVGGSFVSEPVDLRIATRRAADRDQSTEALGFRCASSLTPGVDIAQTVLNEDLPPELRPGNAVFDPARVLAIDRWRSKPGKVMAPLAKSDPKDGKDGKDEKPQPLPGYAIVEGYDYVLYVPTKDIDGSTVKNLADASLEQGPVALGMLSLSVPSVEPALQPGTYVLSYRGAGEAKVPAAAAPDDKTGIAQDAPKAATVRLPDGYDIQQSAFLIHKPDGEPVTFLPATGIEMGRPVQPTAVKVKGTRQVPGVNEKGAPVMVQEPVDVLNLKLNSAVRISNKGYVYDVQLKFAEGTLSQGWR